ncbi:3-dehydroquinate synthase family protein [uncultured Subdoligranulum sp.]|uniref:3-dehydroquinate synthase n=1 Tax=uncultured Subdoligranulum sp. TaxID=512298 RepID=UPI0025D145EB|nr:3-dehydroquinate synthase family protein [uncultured Subdoligranulum sp.]
MKLTMHLGSRSYDIILKRGCLANLHQFTDLAHRKVFVLTDSGVPADYARTVLDQCADGTLYTVPQGETSKSLKVYGEVLGAMLAFGMGRRDLLVAVGGGVVGDLGGFCAASYMRGIDFVNCPTTTLSQIDSSIGGKTGLDLGATKNIVGAFWQPRAVLIDPDTLATLPRRHFVNGLAEAVKAGLIADPELFELFETGDVDADIETIIYRSLQVKKKIVEQDEREGGARRALNFGHTIGHGIEAVKGVRGRRTNGLYHGECVALGMLPMIEDRKLQKRTRAVLRKLGLPVRTGVDKRKVLGYMQHDKKGAGSTITVIRVPGLGCWRADAIPMSGLPALLGLDEE